MNVRFILIFIRLGEFTMIKDHNMRDRNARKTIKLPLLYYFNTFKKQFQVILEIIQVFTILFQFLVFFAEQLLFVFTMYIFTRIEENK